MRQWFICFLFLLPFTPLLFGQKAQRGYLTARDYVVTNEQDTVALSKLPDYLRIDKATEIAGQEYEPGAFAFYSSPTNYETCGAGFFGTGEAFPEGHPMKWADSYSSGGKVLFWEFNEFGEAINFTYQNLYGLKFYKYSIDDITGRRTDDYVYSEYTPDFISREYYKNGRYEKSFVGYFQNPKPEDGNRIFAMLDDIDSATNSLFETIDDSRYLKLNSDNRPGENFTINGAYTKLLLDSFVVDGMFSKSILSEGKLAVSYGPNKTEYTRTGINKKIGANTITLTFPNDGGTIATVEKTRAENEYHWDEYAGVLWKNVYSNGYIVVVAYTNEPLSSITIEQ